MNIACDQEDIFVRLEFWDFCIEYIFPCRFVPLFHLISSSSSNSISGSSVGPDGLLSFGMTSGRISGFSISFIINSLRNAIQSDLLTYSERPQFPQHKLFPSRYVLSLPQFMQIKIFELMLSFISKINLR